MRRKTAFVLAAATVAILPGCKKKQPEHSAERAETTAAPPAAEPKPGKPQVVADRAETKQRTLAAHMDKHLDEAAKIRDALVVGDLVATRDPAKWLRDEHTVQKKMPEIWLPFVRAMQQANERVTTAKTIADASSAVAQMVQACGDCHVKTATQVKFKLPDLPPNDKTTKAHMARHAWAMARLWEGVSGPSDYAWQTATAVLAEAALAADDLRAYNKLPKTAGALADQVHALGQKAAEAKGVAERANSYGQLLGTCSGCHEKLGQLGGGA